MICPGSRDGNDAALKSRCGAISSEMLLLCLEARLSRVAPPLAARIIEFWGKAVFGNIVSTALLLQLMSLVSVRDWRAFHLFPCLFFHLSHLPG